MENSLIDHKAIIRSAAARAGGIVALSKKLGLSRATVSLWAKVPDTHLIRVEELTGVPREELRPDIFARSQQAA